VPRGARGRRLGDHALPAARPARLAACCAVRAARDLTSPSHRVEGAGEQPRLWLDMAGVKFWNMRCVLQARL
jgi:hypothetical protein